MDVDRLDAITLHCITTAPNSLYYSPITVDPDRL